MPKFDIAAALADGYSYSEIASYLSELHGFDLNAAKYDGIGDEEVAGFLSAREVRPPVESGSDFGAGVKQLGRLAYDFPTQVQGAVGALMYDPLEPEGTGARWMDVADKRNRERAAQLELEGTAEKKFLPGISVGNVQDASSSTGFSAVAMGPSIAGEIGATLAAKAPNPAVKLGGQALSYLGGAGGSAIAGKNMDEAMFTKQLLERANQQMLRTDGRPMTDEETRKYLDETAEIRSQHGLWEAGPEAVGNALEVIGLRKIFSGLAKGNLLGAVAGLVMNQATEHTTETITGMGQQPLEVDGGLSNEKPYEMGNLQDWGAAFKEQAPVTAVLGGVTGGAAGAAGKLYGMTRPPLQATPEPERQMPDFEAARQQVESLQVPTPIIPPLKPTDFAGISAVPDALSAMRTQPTVTAKVDTATQQVENATTPKGYGNPLDTAGEIITAVRGADEAKLAELEKAIEAPELDDFAAAIRGDIADRRDELAKRPEILPADPQPDPQLIERTLAAISTADQPTLLQMADGLPGLVEGSPELAPYQRQLSEAISERQRILWEESNVGRGKVSGDKGSIGNADGGDDGILRGDRRGPASLAGFGGKETQGVTAGGRAGTSIESVLPKQGDAPEAEQTSPLLTAARQHVAETGDMTMGGLMKALDVDIDTAEKLLEQVKATTPLPRNIAGTQAATRGADTSGFLNEQAIRKAGATSLATTAGDAQGFLADQGIRKATGTATAAPATDTGGFVRDQQIRREAMGRVDKPVRREGESARAFLARKREWEKSEAKPLAEEMFSAANKITRGGAANPFVLSKKGQVEVMSRAAKEIDPRLNTDERFHDALTSVGAVGRLPVRSANRKLASAFSSILLYRLDPESSRLEMAAALRGDEDEMARLVDKNALVRMRRNENNSEDYELTSLGKKLLARFGEIGAVALAEKNISVSSRAENETQAELPRTDETQAVDQGGGQGEYDYYLSAVWRGRAPQVAAPTVLKSTTGGKEYAIPGLEELRVTVKPPSGNKAKHTKLGWSVYVGDNLIWANLPGVADTAENAINSARGKLKRIHAAIAKDQAQTTPKPTSTSDLPGVGTGTAPSPGEASNIKAIAGGEDGETLRRGEEGTADYGTTTNGAGGQKNATRGGAAGSGRAADVDQPQREQWELTAAEWEKAHARDRRLEREAIEKVDRLKRQPRPKSVSANLRYLEKISAAEKVLREASENANRWGGEAVRKEVVRRAHESGKPVPSAILAEFPDIASNAKNQQSADMDDIPETDFGNIKKGEIYPTTVGGKKMYAIRGDNPRGGGDSLFGTREEAQTEVERAAKVKAANEKSRAEQEAMEDAKNKASNEREERRKADLAGKQALWFDEGHISGLSDMARGRLMKALAKRYSTSAGEMTLREYVESGGFTGTDVSEVPAVQYDRAKFNRMTQREQAEYNKKLEEKKTEYSVTRDDGTYFVIPKIVYDAIRKAAQPSASKATPEKPAGVATSGQRQEQTAKEPWQMTREEYIADLNERTKQAEAAEIMALKAASVERKPGLKTRALQITRKDLAGWRGALEDKGNEHRAAVSKALADGILVPASVLAEYPELADAKTRKDAEMADAAETGFGDMESEQERKEREFNERIEAKRKEREEQESEEKRMGRRGKEMERHFNLRFDEDAGQTDKQMEAAIDAWIAGSGDAPSRIFGDSKGNPLTGKTILSSSPSKSFIARVKRMANEAKRPFAVVRRDDRNGVPVAGFIVELPSWYNERRTSGDPIILEQYFFDRATNTVLETVLPDEANRTGFVLPQDRAAQPAQAEASSGGRGEGDTPLPEFAQRAGVKTWQQATTAGLRVVIADAKAMADEVVKVAANWIYSDPDVFADRIAEQIVYQTKLAGGRDAALRALENQYASKAQGRGSFEPGEKERYEALSRGFSGLMGGKPKVAEAAPVEPEVIPEQRLLDTGFLREFRDRWQYKLAGNNGWFTADKKEDAVERARKAYEKTPESERLTAQERFDKSTAEQNADIERLYGDNSLPELRKEYARMEREIASLQKAGRREFGGNGGRRTGAAVSNEGARNIGEQKLKLGRYIEDREKAEKESTPTRLHTVSGYPSDNATKKHMLEAIAGARKELPEPSPKDGFGNAERIDWPKPTTEKSRKIYRLAGNFKLVVDPTGYARLVEDMGSSGKDGSKIPDKVHGKPIGNLAEAKLWAEYYLLGKAEPSGPPHVFRGKNKEYEYTVPNSAYALDRFENKVKGSSGVKFAKALPPSSRADIPGELAQAFGKLRARVLMRKITVLGSQEEAKALVARLKGATAKYSKDGVIQGLTATVEGAPSVYLVADGIAKNQAVPVLLHELGEHAAQLGFAGDREYQGILRSLGKRAEAQTATGKAIRAAMARVPEDTAPEHYWSEVAAYLIENKANSEIGIVKRILNFFKRWLYKAGAINADRLTPEDLVLFARAATLAHTGATYGEGVRQSVRESIQQAKAFFSKLQQVSDDKFGGMKAQSVEPFLLKQGVKKTEIEATGLREWLAAMKPTDKVTKEQLRDFVRANTVEFEDVVLGMGKQDNNLDEWDTESLARLYEDEIGENSKGVEREDLIREIRKANITYNVTDPTYFDQYTEPGAIPGSYREMFVTAPDYYSRGEWSRLREERDLLYRTKPEGWRRRDDELAVAMQEIMDGQGGRDWQDGHSQYSEIKNPIVRIRFNEVAGPNGERVLRVEEMQGPSDESQKEMPKYLRNNIYQTGVKRILAYAKENGFDGVALAAKPGRTAGETQADRYSLAKQVRELRYYPYNQVLQAWKDEVDSEGYQEAVLEESVPPEKIQDYIGKEVARKLLDAPLSAETPSGHHKLVGQELEIGGTGLKRLYDTDLPNIFKAWGGTKMGDLGGMPYIPVDKAASSYPMFSRRFEADEAEVAVQVKPALRKNELKWWERVFKTFDYLSRLDPASKRIFQYGSEDRRENKVRLEDRILDDISVPDGAYIDPQYAEKKKAGFVAYLTELQKKDKATYTAANDYLLQVDRTGKAFAIKRQEGYTVTTPDGEVLATGLRTKEDGYAVIRSHHAANSGNGSSVLMKDYGNDKKPSWIVTNPKGAVLSEHDTENEAVVARREAEAGKMRADGKDEKTIAAVMKFREMTDRAFDLMAGDLRRVIDEAERLGLDEPTMEVVDERKRYVILDARGNKVPESYYENRKDADLFAKSISHKGRFQVKRQEDNEILMPMTLSAAIAQMGDLRGSYFPRQRQPGAVVMTATKDGHNIRKNFDLYALGGERVDIESGEVITESKLKTFLRDRANQYTPLGREMAKLKADGYTVNVAPAEKMPETVFEATQLFASINALIEDAAKGVKEGGDPNLQQAYNELAKTLTMSIADTFKQRGYLSSRMKRVNDYWEGFETDMLKAGVQYAKGMAGGLAKREAAQKMTLALTGREVTFAEYVEQSPDATWEDYQQFVRDNAIDPKTQPRLLEETKSWMQEMLRNDEQADRILGTIKGLAVLKFLGFRVSSAAVNMTNMVQAVPATIAAQTGTSISRALGQVGSSARLYKQYRTGKAEQIDKEIFTEISERGWDNPQFNHEAAAVLRSKAGNWFAKFTDAAMWMFGQAEKVNRAVTIHAAYMQAKRMSPDLGHVGWMNKAKQISDDAHGVYGKETAPAWTRGAYNPLKLAYTFQRFMHNYFLNMGQMWERGKYKELTWMLISPALIAGPGATLLTPIAASMLGALGIGGDDPEEEFYTWAEQTFGEGSTGARVARHGFAGALGVNLKGSLEMGFAMPTTVAELFGAPGSLVTDAVDSVRAFGKGEVSKGFEKALPTGIGTMLKANREQREGVTTGGYSPVWYGEEPLKTTGGGSVARFFGFNPSVTSGVREKLWSEKRIEQKYAGERKRINDRIRRLVLQNNGRIPREDMDEIRGEVARYNERARGLAVPGVPLIKASTIRQAIRSAKRPPRKERLRTNPNI